MPEILFQLEMENYAIGISQQLHPFKKDHTSLVSHNFGGHGLLVVG